MIQREVQKVAQLYQHLQRREKLVLMEYKRLTKMTTRIALGDKPEGRKRTQLLARA